MASQAWELHWVLFLWTLKKNSTLREVRESMSKPMSQNDDLDSDFYSDNRVDYLKRDSVRSLLSLVHTDVMKSYEGGDSEYDVWNYFDSLEADNSVDGFTQERLQGIIDVTFYQFVVYASLYNDIHRLHAAMNVKDFFATFPMRKNTKRFTKSDMENFFDAVDTKIPTPYACLIYSADVLCAFLYDLVNRDDEKFREFFTGLIVSKMMNNDCPTDFLKGVKAFGDDTSGIPWSIFSVMFCGEEELAHFYR